jgi:hypothetical protein
MADRKEKFSISEQDLNEAGPSNSKLRKTAAERAKEYRERKKQKNEIQNDKRPKKTNAEKQKEYRERVKLKNITDNDEQLKKHAERQAEYCKRIKLANNENELTLADKEFEKRFTLNTFGHACDICHRLWFKNDMKRVQECHVDLLIFEFPDEDISKFLCCSTCYQALTNYKVPALSRSNGFAYPKYPDDLPPLDCMSERLVSPRLPFMQLRRLRWENGSHGIIGQVINVPVDVNNMVTQLPRELDDDYTLNVHIRRHLIHKSSYLKGYVKKGVIKQWLRYLLNTPLYKLYNIKVDESFIGLSTPVEEEIEIEPMTDQNDQENELLIAQQQTLMWNEDKYLCLAPGQNQTPLSIIFDEHAEELSFPSIYLGHPRLFKEVVKVTPFMMATSEIRRKDRRGVTPHHILYVAMKILRLRLTQGMFSTFKCTGDMSTVTKKMIEDKQFLEQCIERNLSFLKSIPNSVQYWAQRKKDVFAMIRQLGKPTMFLTLSSSEVKWPDLLKILHKLKYERDLDGDPFEQLNSYQRCTLVNEDPVTCVIYFNKLVDVIMNILSLQARSPFGKYRVIDYFKRIEFQHRGSAHAHILLWMDNDPKETIGEDMPQTINLINHLCSLSYKNSKFGSSQIHNHTFTCYKKNDKQCRFNAPFWPMDKTRVLIPMSAEDGRRKGYAKKFKNLKQNLEEKYYDTFDAFLTENSIDNIDEYLNILRSGIKRPMVLMQRTIEQIWVNSFNNWLLKIIRSNMDLQFILEEYSCAAYVVEYVNKTNRGISNLQKELLKLREEYPDKDYNEMLGALSVKMLNTVEMSSQEAAWYLLRQPMSESSRKIEYIPTV